MELQDTRTAARSGQVRKALNELVFEVLLAIQSEADAQQIELRPILAFDLPPCFVDEFQFGQALRLLLRRACTAAAHCEPARRTVTVSTVTHRDGSIVLEVGNPAEQPAAEPPPDLTEPPLTPNLDDSGDLLQICHIVARAHGGRFALRGHGPNSGTTFRMILPPAQRGRL